MERLGDRYLVGDPLGGATIEQIFSGAMADANESPGTEITLEFAERRLAMTPGAIDQLRELVRWLAGVRGPNLAAVHDVVADSARVALVVDPLPPTTLRNWLVGHGPLLPAHVAQLGAEIAGALDQVHDVGVLHLGLTPENIRMDGGSAKVTGQCLGSVRLSTGPENRDAAIAAMSRYVAPKLIRGDPASARHGHVRARNRALRSLLRRAFVRRRPPGGASGAPGVSARRAQGHARRTAVRHRGTGGEGPGGTTRRTGRATSAHRHRRATRNSGSGLASS